jgi:outer membrane protein TolC
MMPFIGRNVRFSVFAVPFTIIRRPYVGFGHRINRPHYAFAVLEPTARAAERLGRIIFRVLDGMMTRIGLAGIWAVCLTGCALPVLCQNAAPLPPMPAAVPQNQQLTLKQALDVGASQSPLISAAQHTAQGARNNLSGQKAPLNPTLTFAAINNSFVPLTWDSLGNAANYSVTLPIEISNRRAYRTRQALGQYQASNADFQTARISVAESVAGAYIGLQVANLSLESEMEAYDVAKRLNDLTEQQFKLGAAPETNAIRTRIALTQEEQNLYQAIENVNVGRTGLNVALGRPADTPVDASEKLSFSPAPASLPDLQRLALSNRPEIRSAEATRHALQAGVALEQSQYYPDLLLATDLRADQVAVGITFPLFDFGSIRGAVRTAREAVHTQEAQERQTREGVGQDVSTAFYALQAAEQTVRSFQDGILPRAISLESRIEQGYKLGASTVLDLIDAQETLRTTRLAYDQSLGNYRSAYAQLERAIGGPVPGSGR